MRSSLHPKRGDERERTTLAHLFSFFKKLILIDFNFYKFPLNSKKI